MVVAERRRDRALRPSRAFRHGLILAALTALGACTGTGGSDEADQRDQAGSGTEQAAQSGPPDDGYTYRFLLEGVSKGKLRSLLLSASDLQEGRKERLLSFYRLQTLIDQDIDAFRTVLRSQGYYAPRLTSRLTRSGQTPVARILVEPGPRYMVKAAEIVFVDAPSPSDATVAALRESMLVAEGDPAVAKPIVESQTRMVRALPRLGYPFAAARDRSVVVDHADRTMTVTYRFAPGPKSTFGTVDYDGLTSVSEGYVDRLRPWTEGERYDDDKVRAFQKTLSRTGLFDLIQVSPRRPSDADPDAAAEAASETGAQPADLLVKAEEAQHRTISVGAGFSTNTGAGGDVTWEHRNLLGGAERLRVVARGTQINQSLRASLTKPHFRRLDQTLLIEAEYRRQDTDAFIENTGILGFGLERQLSPRWTLTAGIDLSYTDVQTTDRSRQFGLGSLPVSLRYDNTGDLLNPTRGVRVTARTTPFGGIGDELLYFHRNELLTSGYIPLDSERDLVVALRSRLGSIAGENLITIPANQRFFAGGGGSIRGFGFQEVGPEGSRGNPTGGRSVAEAGLELRWKLTESIGLVPFLEGGNVYAETLPQFSGFEYGGGLGVRYYTSFGPIRFDVATPINPAPGDQRVQFYISIGQSF